MRSLILPAVALLGLSCNVTQVSHETDSAGTAAHASKDDALRFLLNVGSISGQVVFPDDTQHYWVTYLKFEDGRCVGSGKIVDHEIGKDAPRKISVELLWGSSDEGTQVVVKRGGYLSKERDDFFTRLDGDRTSGGTTVNGRKYGQYFIIAWAASSEKSTASTTCEFVPANIHKYVAALAVRFFTNKPQLEEAKSIIPWPANQRR
ncbi:MAG TPA: hypothetical protein HPP83_07055 [Candidatus Hydrogenedentes bacterium]|nr:hypothetical protein [Candidatus Hydrogenedentota bacterium]